MKLKFIIALFVCLVLAAFTTPRLANAFSITEAWSSSEPGYPQNNVVEFTVDNSGPPYSNIVEFVVGNNDIQATGTASAQLQGWEGTIAWNHGSEDEPSWYTLGEVALDWLNEVDAFDSYHAAFYYYDKAVYDEKLQNNPLPMDQTTGGFTGYTFQLASPFAIRNSSGSVVLTGDTNTSPVPLPGTALLFASGMGALGFTARRKV